MHISDGWRRDRGGKRIEKDGVKGEGDGVSRAGVASDCGNDLRRRESWEDVLYTVCTKYCVSSTYYLVNIWEL
jgi:hypothetical protein